MTLEYKTITQLGRMNCSLNTQWDLHLWFIGKKFVINILVGLNLAYMKTHPHTE